MSQSNSLARKRRSGIVTNSPPHPSSFQSHSQTANMKQVGLTLPQVVSVIDSRLIQLETFMKETKSMTVGQTENNGLSVKPTMPVISEVDERITNEFIIEANHRFDFLMNEIVDLKDVVMKLQAYTMEVNKTLLEERIHLLSDIGFLPTTEQVAAIADIGPLVEEPIYTDEFTLSDSV